MTPGEWEALCDGCALCCRVDKQHNVACPSLDCDKRRCTVYERRTQTETCVKMTPGNVASLHERGVLPDTCGYVRWMQGKEPARLPPEQVPEVPLVPFILAPFEWQNRYVRIRKKWLEMVND